MLAGWSQLWACSSEGAELLGASPAENEVAAGTAPGDLQETEMQGSFDPNSEANSPPEGAPTTSAPAADSSSVPSLPAPPQGQAPPEPLPATVPSGPEPPAGEPPAPSLPSGVVTSGQCDAGVSEELIQSFNPALFSNGDNPSLSDACQGLNPERGVFSFFNLRDLESLEQQRQFGSTLIYGQVLIDDYRDRDLDDALLSNLSASFQAVRDAGLKVLPRFYYAAGGSDADAPLARVLGHIRQLGPLLTENSDVIAALHAGFVGAWGEWHASTNNLTEPEARQAIFDALLAALPETRMVLARRPSHKQQAYGGPLTEATAYRQDSLSRVGHLNDCFLASDSDFGTYQLSGEKDYAIADSALTAVGGETCAVNPPRSECASAQQELALHHWSFINTSYHQDVLGSWQSGGCFEAIQCRLGYRLALLGHRSPQALNAGEVLNLSLQLFNDGYARPFNPRSLYVVLDGPVRHELPTDLDWTDFAPGESQDYCLGLSLPADMEAGSYRIGLWLPDPSEMLRSDPRYAAQLVNGVAMDEQGVNWLDASVEVTN